MEAKNLKVPIKAEGLEEMKKLLNEASEKIKELGKILKDINSTEIKIAAELPEKQEG